MPELPEVETIRQQLATEYIGESIKSVVVQPVRIFQNISPEGFKKELCEKRIKNLHRHGKYLIFDCESKYPVFHLGMSGIFIKNKSDSLHPKHIHIQFNFASGKKLYFQDVRKFGKVWIYDKFPDFPYSGIDPLDKKFSLNRFKKLLTSKNMNIKLFLMDQSLIAGIGNIYANEILFYSGISPLNKTSEIIDKCKTLYTAINFILIEAIKKFGTSYSAYRTVSGTPGQNQNFLKVYQRENKDCYICGAKIQKIILGSRSTFYCPNCQR